MASPICGYCKDPGHYQTTCPKKHIDIDDSIRSLQDFVDNLEKATAFDHQVIQRMEKRYRDQQQRLDCAKKEIRKLTLIVTENKELQNRWQKKNELESGTTPKDESNDGDSDEQVEAQRTTRGSSSGNYNLRKLETEVKHLHVEEKDDSRAEAKATGQKQPGPSRTKGSRKKDPE